MARSDYKQVDDDLNVTEGHLEMGRYQVKKEHYYVMHVDDVVVVVVVPQKKSYVDAVVVVEVSQKKGYDMMRKKRDKVKGEKNVNDCMRENGGLEELVEDETYGEEEDY